MQLTVRPNHKNEYPLRGIVIKGETLASWLGEIQRLGLSPEDAKCYPLPGYRANSLWGCLLVPEEGRMPAAIGWNSYCQQVHPLLFIPEHSQLSPLLSETELDKLVKDSLHFYHPSVGWVELTDPMRWEDLIQLPTMPEAAIVSPEEGLRMPGAVRSFQVVGLPPEEVLEKLDSQLLPGKVDTKKGPLSIGEKILLFLLKMVFAGGIPLIPAAGGKEKAPSKETGKESWFQRVMTKFRPGWLNRWEDKLADLEERNKMQVDNLLDMFLKNPEEALKYAIPLDDGTARGSGMSGLLQLVQRWQSFSPFGHSGGNGGGGRVVLPDDAFQRLNKQYHDTAKELIKRKDYQKAAFIYLRLLKDYSLAAQTLEEGGLYAEAASVYLKYTKDKAKAAACYEKGGMVQQAIQLFTELGNDEKVGDLYRSINRKEEAHHYYEKVTRGYTTNSQYMKASFIVRDKMEDEPRAQALLIEGWRSGRDSVDCLSSYFAHYEDKSQLGEEMIRIYTDEMPPELRTDYLRVLKFSCLPKEEVAELARDLAYEIIALEVVKEPSIVVELQAFHKDDRNLNRDILKYKHFRRW